MFYHVTTDEQGFITKISKDKQVSTEDVKWYSRFIPDEDQSNFVTYFDKYRVDDEGILRMPQNLPEVTVSTLQKQLDAAMNTNTKLEATVYKEQQLVSFLMTKLTEINNLKAGK